jgi:sporulation protein YlmC with PRC-barrel domain
MKHVLKSTTAIAFSVALCGSALANGSAYQTSVPGSFQLAQSGMAAPGGPAERSTTPSGTLTDSQEYGSLADTPDYDGAIVGGYTRTDLIGKEVVGADGETIGEISDVMIDRQNKSASWVVVDAGGFLGMGSRTVAIDINKLQRKDGKLAAMMTKDEIKGLHPVG